jgi:hypothetical protein
LFAILDFPDEPLFADEALFESDLLVLLFVDLFLEKLRLLDFEWPPLIDLFGARLVVDGRAAGFDLLGALLAVDGRLADLDIERPPPLEAPCPIRCAIKSEGKASAKNTSISPNLCFMLNVYAFMIIVFDRIYLRLH